jgi:hypothetical protein
MAIRCGDYSSENQIPRSRCIRAKLSDYVATQQYWEFVPMPRSLSGRSGNQSEDPEELELHVEEEKDRVQISAFPRGRLHGLFGT